MKKNAIFFVIMIGITIFGFSQSLQLTDNKGVVIPNNSEIIQATGPDGTEIITYMYVKNIGTKDISVLCRKSQFKMLDSTEITMCWAGACYPASTFLSPNAQLITVGQTITDFTGHYLQIKYRPLKSGESVVRWSFFDMDNHGDSVSVQVKYYSYPLGIPEPAYRQATLSNVYPNPASDQAHVNYELPAGTTGTVVVRDMIGKMVYRENLETLSGKATIVTQNFSDGIYFCSLLVNEKAVQTRKMVVKH
jgi:hypothetical protein